MNNHRSFLSYQAIRAGACLCAAGLSAAHGAIVSVDMDTSTVGIQSTRTAVSGEVFPVHIYLTADAAGIQAYGVSVRSDNAELTITGAPVEPVPTGFAGPLGLGTLTTFNVVAGLDQVASFDSVTFPPGVSGPVSTSFVISTITYTVGIVANDGVADVIPGFFAPVVDGLLDNAAVDISGPTVINPGYVVPEPGETAAVLGGVALLAGIAIRRRKHRATNVPTPAKG